MNIQRMIGQDRLPRKEVNDLNTVHGWFSAHVWSLLVGKRYADKYLLDSPPTGVNTTDSL